MAAHSYGTAAQKGVKTNEYEVVRTGRPGSDKRCLLNCANQLPRFFQFGLTFVQSSLKALQRDRRNLSKLEISEAIARAEEAREEVLPVTGKTSSKGGRPASASISHCCRCSLIRNLVRLLWLRAGRDRGAGALQFSMRSSSRGLIRPDHRLGALLGA